MPARGPRSVLCVVRGDEVGVRHRARVDLAGDQSGDVRHVDDHRRADAARDLGDAREVDDARVGARAHHDHLRLVLVREPRELVVVDPLVLFAHAVRNDGVELAREIQRVAVREVSAVREVHAEDRVARLEQRQVDAHVRLRAGVRLHVGMLGAEERLGAADGERFDDVDELAAAVVALAGIALRVLVGEHRAGRFEDGRADEVLGRDQLEAARLAVGFLADGVGDFRVGRFERALHQGEWSHKQVRRVRQAWCTGAVRRAHTALSVWYAKSQKGPGPFSEAAEGL